MEFVGFTLASRPRSQKNRQQEKAPRHNVPKAREDEINLRGAISTEQQTKPATASQTGREGPLSKGEGRSGNSMLCYYFQSPKMASSLILLDLVSRKERKESRQRKDNSGKNIILSFQTQAIYLTDKNQTHECVYTWNGGAGINWIRGLDDRS